MLWASYITDMQTPPPTPLLGPALAGLTDGLVARAESDRLLAPLLLALAALIRRIVTRFDSMVDAYNQGLLQVPPPPAPRPASPSPRAVLPPPAPTPSWRDLFAWWPWRAGAQEDFGWAQAPRAPRAPRAPAPRSTPAPRIAAPRTRTDSPCDSPPAPAPRPRAQARPHPARRPPVRAPIPARIPARRALPSPFRKNRLPVLA